MSNSIFLFIIVFLLVPVDVNAVTFPDKPAPANYYVDKAGLIDQTTATEIDSKATALLNEEKIPLYIVTIKSLASMDAVTSSIDQYATALYDHWGIGRKDRNYGILLLISKGDRKARIELGANWGRKFDPQAQQVMDELIVPAFKRGKYSQGIADGVRGLDAMARGLQLPQPTTPWWLLPAIIVGAILFILLVINLFKTGRKGWAWALIAGMAVFIFFLLRAMASSSGSSDGFGGGSSGGGGATGSW